MKLKFYLVLLLSLTSLFYMNLDVVTSIGYEDKAVRRDEKNWVTANIDGDVSLPAAVDASFWNFHTVGFDDGVEWVANFGDEVTVALKTSWGDSGHLAVGMWWTKGFKEERKIPIHDTNIRVDFDILLEKFVYTPTGEWLRVALACAVQRLDGSVVYTELDILDSPHTLRHPNGNILVGGDIIFKGGDVVEFKVDEIPLQTWKHYSFDLTRYIDKAWAIEEGDRLESVYIVIESDVNPIEVDLKIDNLWIRSLTHQMGYASPKNVPSAVHAHHEKDDQHSEDDESSNYRVEASF